MNATIELPSRIFVVGSPRSGTTLLQSLIAAHSQVLGFTESHFFDQGFRHSALTGSWRVHQALHPWVHKFFQENSSASFLTSEALLKSLTGDAISDAKRLIQLLDECATRLEKPVWVEKTPDHVRRIELLTAVAPDAKFVHLVRRPVDTILSLRKAKLQWGGQNSWLRCFGHWYSAMSCSRRCLGRPNHFFITYEDLTANPAVVTQRLFAGLDLPWESDLDQKRVAATRSLVRADEKWKANTFSLVQSRPLASDRALPAWLRIVIRRLKVYDTLRGHCIASEVAG